MTEAVNTGSDTFKVAFCAAASAPIAGNSILANLTTATTNMDTVTLILASSGIDTGKQKVDFENLTMTATAGGTGPFRYVVIYDDTVAADPLVCWFDYASEITVADTETFELIFNAAGLFTVE
jgi:hypothetical protein